MAKEEKRDSLDIVYLFKLLFSRFLLFLFKYNQPLSIDLKLEEWDFKLQTLEQKINNKKKLRIAIISPGNFSVPPVIGSSVEHDIEMVARDMKEAHQLIIYTRKCKEYPNSTKEENIKYKRFLYKNAAHYLKKVIEDLKKEAPDIIQIENRPKYVIPLRGHFPKTPILLNMHSMQFASSPWISNKLVNQAMDSIDALITNSSFLKSEYIKKFPCLKEKAYSVHLGIDLSPYIDAERDIGKIDSLKKKYKIKNNDKVLLFAGRLKKEKGVHLIIRSLPEVLQAQKNIKLLIVGSPKYGHVRSTPYLKNLMSEAMKLRSNILFTGFIKPDNMASIYQLADIVVTPSVWKEPFCRVNLEAMSAGKPLITTHRGGIPEVVKQDKTGIVLPLKGISKSLPLAIVSLLQNKELADKLGANGRKRAKKFTWKNTADKYISLYHHILSSSESKANDILTEAVTSN